MSIPGYLLGEPFQNPQQIIRSRRLCDDFIYVKGAVSLAVGGRQRTTVDDDPAGKFRLPDDLQKFNPLKPGMR